MKNLLTFFSVLILLPVAAQNITNETNFFIDEDLEIRTNGDFTNTGLFQNKGTFALKGNWLNAFVYQGNGMVVLEGFDQSLANNDQPIYHLSIKGGGEKNLQGKLSVNSTIDFNNGILKVNETDTLLMALGSTITGGSSISYVDGALISAGNGYKFFPVGKDGKYHPVELEDVRGINPVIQMEVFGDLPDVETTYPTAVLQDIYWERKTISGSFESSPITLGYDLDGITNLSWLVILEGEDLDSVFSISDRPSINTSSNPNVTSSVRILTKNFFALGELLVDPPRQYYLSTTLSPNADNPNNRSVKVFGDRVMPVDFFFQVFNRWGLLIFETDSFDKMSTKGWDGAQNGNVLPSGIYPYSIKYIDTSGKASQQTGFITIVH